MMGILNSEDTEMNYDGTTYIKNTRKGESLVQVAEESLSGSQRSWANDATFYGIHF